MRISLIILCVQRDNFMKELWESTINAYNDYRGTGKLLALFLVSVLIIYVIKCERSKESDREILSPLLFVLSPTAGIGYAFTLVYDRYLGQEEESDGRKAFLNRVLIGLLIMLTLALSGRLVFMEAAVGSVQALLLIPVYIGIYILLSFRLFADRKLRWFMVLSIVVLSLWGYQSQALLPVTLLSTGVSIPGVLVHAVLPLVLWVVIDKYRKYARSGPVPDAEDKKELDYYEWEEEDMKNHKIINSRNLAIALLIVVVIMLGAIFVMNRKINNLYETTVNLQNQVNELQQ